MAQDYKAESRFPNFLAKSLSKDFIYTLSNAETPFLPLDFSDWLLVRSGKCHAVFQKIRFFLTSIFPPMQNALSPFDVFKSFLQVPPHLKIILWLKGLNLCGLNQQNDYIYPICLTNHNHDPGVIRISAHFRRKYSIALFCLRTGAMSLSFLFVQSLHMARNTVDCEGKCLLREGFA